MSLTRATAPATKPIDLPDMEGQIRADLSEEAETVKIYIAAVTDRAETELRRAIITQTWDLTLDAFPCVSRRNPFAAIEIPLPPLQSVESVKYLSTNNELTTLDPSKYVVDTSVTPGRIIPAYGQAWPAALDFPGTIRVQFVAGYGDDPADVPDCIRAWLLLNCANLFEHRETLSIGTGGVIELKTLADGLLDPERWEVRL
jgi:uncharacterized phiE125 gp8 family phage protein